MHERKPSRKKPYAARTFAKFRTRSPRKLAGTKVARDIVKLYTREREVSIGGDTEESRIQRGYHAGHLAYQVDVLKMFGDVNPSLDKDGDRRLLMAHEKVKKSRA